MSFLKKIERHLIVGQTFDIFAKKVGLIESADVLKKIGAPAGFDEDDGAWAATSKTKEDLLNFIDKNPTYHVVTQLDMEDDVIAYENRLATVNRLAYYLADGDKSEDLYYEDDLSE